MLALISMDPEEESTRWKFFFSSFDNSDFSGNLSLSWIWRPDNQVLMHILYVIHMVVENLMGKHNHRYHHDEEYDAYFVFHPYGGWEFAGETSSSSSPSSSSWGIWWRSVDMCQTIRWRRRLEYLMSPPTKSSLRVAKCHSYSSCVKYCNHRYSKYCCVKYCKNGVTGLVILGG